jgi:SAM-dependent methyltransferase
MTTHEEHQEQAVDWAHWLKRWDAQQEGYVPEREERFTVMFDVLAQLLPPSFLALDLACGPGSLSQRLLARFPQARAIAIDMDPVMLELGRGALGTVDGRLRWVDADLALRDWVERLGETHVDAVLSTTALHWLEPEPLAEVYREVGRLLRPGGIFLNGDHLAFGPALPTLVSLSDRHLETLWTDDAFAARGIETAEQWWESLSAQTAISPLLAQRHQRFAGKRRQRTPPGYDAHVEALIAAGFREVGTIWQIHSSRVLMAVR